MGWVIWVSGPPGAGVSALVHAAARTLAGLGLHVPVLDAREVRPAAAAARPDVEREVAHRALAMMAALLAEGGVRALVGASGDRTAGRALARGAIPRFAEVAVVSSRGGPPGDYEPPLQPELVLELERGPVSDAVDRLVRFARQVEARAAAPAPPAGAGWAIWITGRPGSGKTSLAEGVARALGARGIAVRILSTAAVRRFLLREAPASETEHEVAHRALACAARHLTEAGAAVIVDATAPRRAWRDAARAMIPRFAEVQLVCAEDTCVAREQAARWGLGPRRAPSGALPGPDVAMDYEESVRAELTLQTDAHDLWTTVEQVLFLARRLHHAAAVRAAG